MSSIIAGGFVLDASLARHCPPVGSGAEKTSADAPRLSNELSAYVTRFAMLVDGGLRLAN